MNYTNAQHIRELVEERKVSLLPVEVSVAFWRYIDSVPRLLPVGTCVDWAKIPLHKSINWYQTSDHDLVEWARTLRIGTIPHVVAWLSPDEPSLLTEFDYGVANMDVFTWGVPDTAYLFGARVEPGGGHYSYGFDAFVEFTGGTLVRGVQ
jgi:hypothetical protein